jgi:endonuclease/exonuclease/phosphatase (EEP) superfamily protein YafD
LKPQRNAAHHVRPGATNIVARLIIGGLSALYLLAVLVFFALRALWPALPPSLALLNSFTPFLFAPLLLALPAALWVRWRALGGLTLFVLGIFIGLYGALFLPPLRATPVAGNSLKVMTFNLGADCCAPGPLIAAIESEQADLVAVQELVGGTTALIQQRLSALYPQMILQPFGGTTGLLNRYPIVKREWFQPGGRGRMALYVVLDVNGVRLHVFVAHLVPVELTRDEEYRLPIGLEDRDRELQVADIARRVSALSGPVLLMGDLNTSDQSRAYATLTRALRDAYRESGWGFGFTFPHQVQFHGLPVPGPLVRIDYILHSPSLYASSAQVDCEHGSDHCYVTATLGFR